MSAESPKLTANQRCRTPTFSAQQPSIFPISELPPELFGLILRFSLPRIDPMEWIWKSDECVPYIRELYKLRRVSTTWRDAIDGTPSLWMLVSSSWPREVVDTALLRSAAGPLIVHHIPRAWDITSVSTEFIHLVNPHRSRWVAAVFALPVQVLPEITDVPIPRLDTLKLALTDGSFAWGNNRTIPCTPIFANTLANIEHIHLNHLPFDWKEVAGTFGRLRTLMLTNLRHCITFDLLFQVIGKNPLLEEIVLIEIEPSGGSPILGSLDPVLPSRLRIFRVSGRVKPLDNIISRVQLPPTLEALVIVARAAWSDNHPSLWVKMVSPLSATVQRLHEKHGGSTIFLMDEAECTWKTETRAKGFKLTLQKLRPAQALKCVASLANTLHCAKNIPDLSFATESTFVEDADILAALITIRTLTYIQRSIDVGNLQIARFLDALGTTNPDNNSHNISFQSLKYLKLRKWRADIDGVTQAIKQRYSMGLGVESSRPHQKLRIDFTASRAVWFEDPERPKVIISMDKIKELRDIEGVRSVGSGCSTEQPGMLAVVWSEEEGREVWG
ncbi:hypothetical protein M407DRAFT_23305 [Tulasnella calospora MUT 4182]|uniref:F-box domain-containing protein n=1 Tax=Tulasnella calospora MUT 4182 TaxID=1051891 RepID=A0A0C3M1B6_9AGAM|nr:hypothetical protein M407DRAFT_23305 [Tulasnella calospora MUT 4182]